MREALGLAGKSVIVTGGVRGVGRGITNCFLEAGADVLTCDIKAPDTLPSAGGKEALYIDSDIRDVEEIQKVVDFAVEKFGRLDVLVNNAGGAPFAEAATASPRFSEAILRLNLIAPLNFCQKANAVMQQQEEGGCIVNIASVSAIRPSPGTAAYGAAKAGVVSLTQSLAVEWAPKVRVNAITAGLILTEQAHLHYGDDEGVAAVASTIPLGRLANPDDVGDVCLFLSSSLARYISGAAVLLHGGGERPAYMSQAKPSADGK